MNSQDLAALSDDTFASVYSLVMVSARNRGFRGFGGDCAAAAIAIKTVFFEADGVLVAGFNDYMLGHSRHIGHVAVVARGAYWDADGQPKDDEDIRCWGMLDPKDPEHAAFARERGERFTAHRAEDAGLYELSEDEVMDAFDVTQSALEAPHSILVESLKAFTLSPVILAARSPVGP